jgi:hypothetical protein
VQSLDLRRPPTSLDNASFNDTGARHFVPGFGGNERRRGGGAIWPTASAHRTNLLIVKWA